jgi:hypothetical protein
MRPNASSGSGCSAELTRALATARQGLRAQRLAGRLAPASAGQGRQLPVMPRFCRMRTTTRRFCACPAIVVLLAT